MEAFEYAGGVNCGHTCHGVALSYGDDSLDEDDYVCDWVGIS